MRGNDISEGRKFSCCSKKDQAHLFGCLPKIAAAVFIAALASSIIFAVSAFAQTNHFKIQNAELSELSATAEGAISSFNEANIVSNITFHKLNDSAKYTITLKNTDSKNHTIESITDDNENLYISYEYDQHTSEQINADADLVFIVTAKYTTAITDINQRVQINNVKFFIHFDGIEEAVSITPDANPNTNDQVIFNVALLIVSAASLTVLGIIALKKHKKASKFIAIGIIAVAAIAATATAKAITVEANSFTLATNYFLKDRLVVTYIDANGDEHEEAVSYNETANIPDQGKDGHTFTGWKDGNDTPVDLSQPITDDIKIYPTFRANTYTIKFDGNGATGGEMASMGCEYGQSCTLSENAFEKTGYHFIGWKYNNNDYADKADVKNIIESGEITMVAQWATNHYTVAFNINTDDTNASGSMADMTNLEYDADYSLTTNTFARTGYDFKGWNTQADGQGEDFTDGQQFRNLTAEDGATITLYAKWPKTIHAINTMQEMTSDVCANTTTPTTAATALDWDGSHHNNSAYVPRTSLKDTRDNKYYLVSKLADGNCWMSQNLELALDSTKALTDATTDLNTKTTWTPENSTLTTLPTSRTWPTVERTASSAAYSYYPDASDRYYQGGTTKSSTPTDSGVEYDWEKTGAYYNWYSATAGSGTYTMMNSNVSDSICPKGWTLPHGAEGNKSYHYLFTKYNASAADTISSPFNFLFAGRYSYSSSAMFGQESYGYLWTSSAATSINNAYQLYLSSSDIFTQSSRFNKSYGLQVRCVAR